MKKIFFVITVMLMVSAAIFIAGCQSQNDISGKAICSEQKARVEYLNTTYLEAKAAYEAQCAPACTDSDGGKNYTVKGYGTVSFPDGEVGYNEEMCYDSGAMYGDAPAECAGANGYGNGLCVIEQYCNADGSQGYEIYKCPNGCSNGACISNNPACIKTDSSNNTYTNISAKGKISGFRDNGISFGPAYDYCYRDGRLIEYYCKMDTPNFNDNYAFKYITCPAGTSCLDGACIAKCIDTDNGNYSVKGTISGIKDNGTSFGPRDDYCYKDGRLIEYYCKLDIFDNYKFDYVTCPAGTKCSDGACKQIPPNIYLGKYKSSYDPNEQISITAKAVEYDGTPATPSEGYNIQFYTNDVLTGQRIDMDQYNAVYNEGNGYWDIQFNAPSLSSSYFTEITLYCSRDNTKCSNSFGSQEWKKNMTFVVGATEEVKLKLALNQQISDVLTGRILGSAQLPVMLALGTFSDEIGENTNIVEYKQTIIFSDAAGKGKFVYAVDDDTNIIDYYLFVDATSEPFYVYNLDFGNPVEYDQTNPKADLVGAKITIQGKEYAITDIEYTSSYIISGMTLMRADTIIWLQQDGKPLVYNPDGIAHEIKVVDVDDAATMCGVSVDGSVQWIREGQTAKVNGISIGVLNSVLTSGAPDMCELYIGASQYKLTSGSEVEVNGVKKTGTSVSIKGTAGTLTDIAYSYVPVDDKYLAAGKSIADPVFGSFAIGLDSVDKNTAGEIYGTASIRKV